MWSPALAHKGFHLPSVAVLPGNDPLGLTDLISYSSNSYHLLKFTIQMKVQSTLQSHRKIVWGLSASIFYAVPHLLGVE